MEITNEKLINSCLDLNKVLALEPPIATVFESKARGAAKDAALKKFIQGLQTEIISVATGQDQATGAYDLQPGDMSVLQPETIEIVFALSPEAAERLKSAPEPSAPETKKVETSKPPKAPAGPKKQSINDFVVRHICHNPEATPDEIQAALQAAGLKKMADSMVAECFKYTKKVFEELRAMGKLA